MYKLILMLVFLSSSTLFAQDYTGKIISKISLEINEDYDPTDIQTDLAHLKGTPFYEQKLNEIIKALYLSRKFHEISLHIAKRKDNTLHLSFIFSLAKQISTIDFSGSTLFSDIFFLRSIASQEGGIFEEYLLMKDKETIKKIYEDLGYYRTKVFLKFHAPKKPHKLKIMISIIEGDPTTINSIAIDSFGKPKSKKIKKRLSIKRGDIYQASILKEEIIKLKRYFFKNRYLVANFSPEIVSFNKDKSKVSIFLKLKPGPKYFFEMDGNLEIGDNTLLAPLHLQSENIIPKVSLQDLVNHMYLEYKKIGHVHASISHRTELDAKNNTKNVLFKIDEKDLIRVNKVIVEGNVHFSAKHYEVVISDLIRSSVSGMVYNPKEIEKIPKLISNNLKTKGFLFARAQIRDFKWDHGNRQVSPIITIEEGPQTIINNISFRGNRFFSDEQLLKAIHLPKGGPLNLFELDIQLSKIISLYRENGFLKSSIEDINSKKLVTYSKDFKESYIQVDLQEGPQSYFGQVFLQGSLQTKSHVLKRALSIEEGKLWKPSLVKKSLDELTRLGLFSYVNIRPASKEFEAGKNNVIVEVTERKPGLIEAGGGFKTDDGFHGFSGVAYRNIGGWHRVVSLRGEINRKIRDYRFLERNIELGLSEPYLGGIPFIARMNAKHKKESTLPFDLVSWEAKFSLDKSLWDFLKTTLSYSFSFSDIFRAINSTDIQQKKIASLGPTLFFDFRDDPFNPHRGSSHMLTSEFFMPIIGSDSKAHLTRNLLTTSWYFTPFKYFTLAFLGRAGIVHSYSKSNPIPVDRRFYLGGRSTIRGFREDIIGSNTKDKKIFESTLLNYKAEIRVPVTDDFGVLGFLDGGNVFFESQPKGNRFRHSVGPGVSYNTPIGPLSLDFGFIIKRDRDKSEPIGRMHFSLGLF